MTKSLTNRSMTYIETRRDLAFAQPGSGRDAPFHDVVDQQARDHAVLRRRAVVFGLRRGHCSPFGLLLAPPYSSDGPPPQMIIANDIITTNIYKEKKWK